MLVKLTRGRVALVVAALAIGIAGVSYAAIPAANGVISACKDSKGALKVIDAEAGQTCNTSQQLLTWSQQGPAGPQGPAGVSGLQIVSTTTAAQSVARKTLLLSCPSGKVALGGGGSVRGTSDAAQTPPESVALTESAPHPTYSASPQTSWRVAGQEVVPTDQLWYVAGWAICANVA